MVGLWVDGSRWVDGDGQVDGYVDCGWKGGCWSGLMAGEWDL